MKKKSVVLLSAGLDSTVNLAVAQAKTEVVLALTFDYGQRASQKELQCAEKICRHYKVPWQVIDIKWLKNLGQSSLTKKDRNVPVGAAVSIDNMKTSKKSAHSVWIPNRNGVFLNIAAAFAESLKAEMVIPGFNAEEAKTFPDNSLSFIEKINQALSFSTMNRVKTKCFTIQMQKPEIVKLGLYHQVPFHLMWPCYFSSTKWCGQCESCQRAKRAFGVNQMTMETYFKT
jgi:7-cyano-7-deazaguanine synthase